MLALAVARELGLSMADAARGIARATFPSMRVELVPIGKKGATLINDAYNASPASMRAAIDVLAGSGSGRQRVAVLGGLGGAPRALGPGDPRVVVATDVDELWKALEPRLASDAVILLKASRGVKIERLVPPLTEWANR